MIGRAMGVAVGLALGMGVALREARAADEPVGFRPGAEFSLRLGPSFVAGNADKGQPLASQVGAPIAFMLDGGYRLHERFYVGGFWAMGFGLVDPRPCPAGYECSGPGLITNIGIGGRFHPLVGTAFDPWVGTGIAVAVEGYSGNRYEDRNGSICFAGCGLTTVKSNVTHIGASVLAEGGLDYHFNRHVGVGLSAAAFVGKYLTYDVTVRDNDRDLPGGSGGGVDGGYHLWILTSARVVVNVN